MISFRHLALVAAATLVPFNAGAQPTNELLVRDIVGCEDCVLHAAKIATLGMDVELPFSNEFVIRRLRDGRFVGSSLAAGGELHVFAPDGSHIGTASRSGRGPGEFSFIQRIIPSGDGFYVFDPAARRRSLLDSSLNFIRSDPVPGQMLSGTALADSLLVASMSVPTRQHVGFRLHIFGPDGSIRRSFDEVEDGFRGDMSVREMRTVAARGSTIYAGHANQYVIDQWSPLGQRRGRLSRDARWFVPWSHRCCTVDPDRPTETLMRDLHVDSAGLLWLLFTVSDRRWAEGIEPSELGPTGFRIADPNRFYDSIVEVVDPAAGALLGSVRLDHAAYAFVGEGLVASHEVDLQSHDVLIHIWRISRPTPGGVEE